MPALLLCNVTGDKINNAFVRRLCPEAEVTFFICRNVIDVADADAATREAEEMISRTVRPPPPAAPHQPNVSRAAPYPSSTLQQTMVAGTQPLDMFPPREQQALARFERLATLFESYLAAPPEARTAAALAAVRAGARETLDLRTDTDLARVQRLLLVDCMRRIVESDAVPG